MKMPGPEKIVEIGFRLRALSVLVSSSLITGALMTASDARAESGMPGVSASTSLKGGEGLSFDSDFLGMGGGTGGQHVDLTYFAHKGGLLPGNYAVQVTVNGKMVDQGRLVTFKSWPDEPGKLYACVSAGELADWWGIIASQKGEPESKSAEDTKNKDSNKGNNRDSGTAGNVVSGKADAGKQDAVMQSSPSDTEGQADSTASTEGADASCPVGGVVAMVPYAKEVFDFNKRSLTLTVPQASLGPASRLRTPPRLWDEGMPAILMNYNYTGSQQNSQGRKTGSDFLGVNGQLNLLGWRIRNDLTWHQQQGGDQELSTSNTYAQRDFASLGGGTLTVGRTTSSGGGVDSVLFTGVTVASDDGMLDPKYTSYKPAITGIANSPATVTVRQYGKVIYQQNVPQGPFSLTDFNSSGNGEVDVEVRESDGSTRHFTMAQAVSSSMMTQGSTSWSTSAGKAANSAGYANAQFVQAGVSYGAWANTTLTGGALVSANYQSLSTGLGLYAGAWGAVSYTLKTSRADLSVVPQQNEGVKTGVSHDLSWSRSFGDTSVGVSWSHAQTKDFYTYSELLSLKPPSDGDDSDNGQSGNQKDSYTLSLSQSMGAWGSVSLSGTRSTTWDSSDVQNNVSLSYNTTVKDIGVGVAVGYSTYTQDDDTGSPGDSGNKTDRTVSVNISLPLGKWLNANSVNGTYSYTRSNGQASQQAGVSGSAMDGALSWSASQGLTGDKTGNTSASYSGNYGSVSGGYSYGGGSNSVSYGVNGGLAIHQHGITAGRSLALSGANALVEIPGVSGVSVNSAVTDWRGYALVSGLTPYDQNRVNVDMTNLPGNLELDASSKNVVPTRGALIGVPFRSSKGFRLMITLEREKDTVPFGATASLDQDDSTAMPVTGIVGDAGQVYMSGMPEKGAVTISWGDGPDSQCRAPYTLPEGTDESKLNTLAVPCR